MVVKTLVAGFGVISCSLYPFFLKFNLLMNDIGYN